MRFCLSALILLFMATPAFAGFEWVPAAETDRVPMTRAKAVYDNAAFSSLGNAPQGMVKGELVINPYPVAANFVPGTDPFTSQQDNVSQAMMEETGLLAPVALGGGLSTGVRAPHVSPAVQQAKESAFAMDPYPLLSKNVESEPLAPMALSDTGMSAMMGGEVPPLPGYDSVTMATNAAPHIPSARPAYEPSAVMPLSTKASGVYTEAVGFRRDLPLALALSQVIPTHYALSFNTGVDAGSNVSWEGGKPWNQVLNDMLTPLGLRADISGKTVSIRKG